LDFWEILSEVTTPKDTSQGVLNLPNLPNLSNHPQRGLVKQKTITPQVADLED
jgi:hypothetical protein